MELLPRTSNIERFCEARTFPREAQTDPGLPLETPLRSRRSGGQGREGSPARLAVATHCDQLVLHRLRVCKHELCPCKGFVQLFRKRSARLITKGP